jgi:hypothetical protein
MNRCMIHGKELRWHSASLCTDHLFSVGLKVKPRLKLETLFLCSAVLAVSLLEVLMQTCFAGLQYQGLRSPNVCSMYTSQFGYRYYI